MSLWRLECDSSPFLGGAQKSHVSSRTVYTMLNYLQHVYPGMLAGGAKCKPTCSKEPCIYTNCVYHHMYIPEPCMGWLQLFGTLELCLFCKRALQNRRYFAKETIFCKRALYLVELPIPYMYQKPCMGWLRL